MKYFCIALAFALVVAVFCPLPTAYAAQNPTISFSGKMLDDGNLQITVNLKNNTGISEALFQLVYDTSALQYLGHDKGSALSSLGFLATGNEVATTEVKFLYYTDDFACDTSNGTMLTLLFKPLDLSGDCRVSFKYKRNKDVFAYKNDKQVFVNPIIHYANVAMDPTMEEPTVSTVTKPQELADDTKLAITVSVVVCLATLLVVLLVVRRYQAARNRKPANSPADKQ